VLASASPRRTALLTMLGLAHEVAPADVDESVLPGEAAPAHVERLAREKARVIAARRPDALVLGSDTVVVLDGEILGKPARRQDAVATLMRLSGRDHVVFTALALAAPRGEVHAVVSSTRVRFRDFDEPTARRYVATGEPMDKAGSYGIQGLGAALIDEVDGDYFTVVGFPIPALVRLLAAAGWRYDFGGLEPL
jgi:septum formation protein